MLESVRARLALWYVGVLALCLAGFALATYIFLARTTRARTDEYLSETAGAIGSALGAARMAHRSDSAAVTAVVREFRFRDIGVVIYDARSGTVLGVNSARAPRWRRRARATRGAAAPDSDALAPPPFAALQRAEPDAEPTLLTLPGERASERVCVFAYRLRARPLIVAVTRSLAGQERTMREARDAFLVAIPLVLALATFGGYALARKSLQPVLAMSNQAARIGATTLHERLPVVNERDELGRLATVFNDLLGRLDRSFEQQRQFMAEASHELRTPVAVMCGEAEFALSRENRSADAYRDALATIHGEGRRLRRIVDDLFLLARANAGDQPLMLAELYLDELTGDCVRAMRALAVRREIALCYEPGGELPFRGDEALLRRLVMNLLDNAIKYTPAGGHVTATAGRRDDGYRIAVADTGPGVPAPLRDRIFERFYRAHASDPRNGATDAGGAGLGLPIARWVAEVHGGRLDLARADAAGSEFVVDLPAAAPADVGPEAGPRPGAVPA